LIVSKHDLCGIFPFLDIKNEYVGSIHKIVRSNHIMHWVRDTMQLVKRIGEKHDLRLINEYACKCRKIIVDDFGKSFNYTFDIHQIDANVRTLLNITPDQLLQIEKIPDDVIQVLTIANGLGSFLKTSKRIVAEYKQMNSYGDITKIHKHCFADPLFNYKFSIKAFDLDTDAVIQHKSNKIVIGYFFGNYKRQGLLNILLKLLGAIVLNNFTDGIKIVIYSFLADTYSKKELQSVEEVIDYFSNPKQLKLFSINNSKALETMIVENPGDDIIYLPNILSSCYVSNSISGSNRVNIISVLECTYNLQYSNVCKKTGGTFLTI